MENWPFKATIFSVAKSSFRKRNDSIESLKIQITFSILKYNGDEHVKQKEVKTGQRL